MSLKGAVTFVAGGTGIVGSGIVRQFLEQGAKVWTAGRNDAKLNELKSQIPADLQSNMALVKADLSNESECVNLREEILKKDGKLNHVVASIGGWRTDGKLGTLTVDNYQKALTDMTLPHFVCYKTFSNYLSQHPKSTYTFITGGSAEAKYFDPRASLLPVSASTIYGMYTSAMSEYKDNKNLSLIQLRLFFWIRKVLDSKFDQKKSQLEVGHDYVAKFVPKIILKNKSELYKIQTRSIGDKFYETF